ncbi:hypothetical protein Bbelb_120410 [Branchiostoma belcheri]|nr:hypothetical protein Bbelb_120410 [Branchiostoma belcheri]
MATPTPRSPSFGAVDVRTGVPCVTFSHLYVHVTCPVVSPCLCAQRGALTEQIVDRETYNSQPSFVRHIHDSYCPEFVVNRTPSETVSLRQALERNVTPRQVTSGGQSI